jgi:hypothetical protein
MAGIGASPASTRIPAKVGYLNGKRALTTGAWRSSHAPKRPSRQRGVQAGLGSARPFFPVAFKVFDPTRPA